MLPLNGMLTPGLTANVSTVASTLLPAMPPATATLLPGSSAAAWLERASLSGGATTKVGTALMLPSAW